jgi:S-disulfanyl-L-cysteine oxidoreductase SoxD
MTVQRNQPAGSRSRRMVVAAFVALWIVALLIFFVRVNARSGGTAADRADPNDAQLVAQGQQIYATRCAACHGANLEGQPGWPDPQNGVLPASPLDARGIAWQQDDRWLFATIKEGGQATAPPGVTSFMPGFAGSLSDEQIWAVLTYIKSTWPPEIQAQQPAAAD